MGFFTFFCWSVAFIFLILIPARIIIRDRRAKAITKQEALDAETPEDRAIRKRKIEEEESGRRQANKNLLIFALLAPIGLLVFGLLSVLFNSPTEIIDDSPAGIIEAGKVDAERIPQLPQILSDNSQNAEKSVLAIWNFFDEGFRLVYSGPESDKFGFLPCTQCAKSIGCPVGSPSTHVELIPGNYEILVDDYGDGNLAWYGTFNFQPNTTYCFSIE